jgi:hypothetical protein
MSVPRQRIASWFVWMRTPAGYSAMARSLALAAFAILAGCVPRTPDPQEADVLFLPTPHAVVEAMLGLAEARANVARAGLAGRVEIRHGDVFDADLSEASVVTVFLFPEINDRLAPKLRRELRPGARIVSHRFGLGDWLPERRIEAHGHPLLRWTVPAR